MYEDERRLELVRNEENLSLFVWHRANGIEVRDNVIKAGLASDERYVRRTWWDLLRRALALENHVYDSNTEPSNQGWKPIDEALILETLARRRSS